MLKKLTHKTHKMKRELLERRALDPCTTACNVECIRQQFPNFSMYAELYMIP